jgi:DNA-binding transcriptional regulator YiaG
MFAHLVKIPNTKEVISLTDFLCTLKREGPGYSLELSFDDMKAAQIAAQELLSFVNAGHIRVSPPPQEPFHEFVRNYRCENNLSQAALGKLLGVTAQAVSRWEDPKIAIQAKTESRVRKKTDRRRFCP